MRGIRLIACALTVFALFAVSSARADEYTKLTYLTFSGPVQLPGVTLPAGTYMFKLADPDSGRRVVQVWDKEGTKLYTTLLTIPDQRMTVTDKPAVMFSERPSGQPAAVKSWFDPDESIGYEFVYPRTQAMQIAKESHSPVLSYSDASAKNDNSAAMKSAKIGRIDENGQSAADNNAANNSAASTAPSASVNKAPAATTAADNDDAASTTTTRAGARPAPSTTAQSNASPSSTTARNSSASSTTAVGTTGTTATSRQRANRVTSNQANQSDRGANAAAPRQSLPKTASPLAGLELLSGLMLAGAFAMRSLRKRTAESL